MESGTLFQRAATDKLSKKIIQGNMKENTMSFFAGLEAFKTGQPKGIDKLNIFYTQYNLVMMELNNNKFDIERKIDELTDKINANKATLLNFGDNNFKKQTAENLKKISENNQIKFGEINWMTFVNLLPDNLLDTHLYFIQDGIKVNNEFILSYIINKINKEVRNTVKLPTNKSQPNSGTNKSKKK